MRSFGRNGGLQFPFQTNGRNVFQKVQGVAVHRAPAMVFLGGLFSFAVLKFKAGDMRHDCAGTAVLIFRAKHVAFPISAGLIVVVLVAADVAFVQLLQHPGHVQRFGSCQVLPWPAQDMLLMHDPLMVRKGSFIGRTSAEQSGVAALSLHVENGVVPHPPVLRGPGRTFQQMAKGDSSTSSEVLLGADCRPHGQIEHKVEKLVVGTVPDDRGEHLADEAPLDVTMLLFNDVGAVFRAVIHKVTLPILFLELLLLGLVFLFFFTAGAV